MPPRIVVGGDRSRSESVLSSFSMFLLHLPYPICFARLGRIRTKTFMPDLTEISEAAETRTRLPRRENLVPKPWPFVCGIESVRVLMIDDEPAVCEPSFSIVLLHGESSTGKELIAEAIPIRASFGELLLHRRFAARNHLSPLGSCIPDAPTSSA